MTGLAGLSQRVARLTEIRAIMTAMKNLSLVETRKLARFIGHQQRMLSNIVAATGDFLQFFPDQGGGDTSAAILVLIGSERGFCGNFNERLITALGAVTSWRQVPSLLLVGHRLGLKLDNHPRVLARLEGATVTEDVPAVLDQLMDALHSARGQLVARSVALSCLSVEADGDACFKRLLPIAPDPAPSAPHLPYPPRLNATPAAFFAGLLDQYLLAELHGCLYGSLAAENRQRLAHMEHALDRLDQKVARLALRRNALRQEKIVEEIEVMLSSAMALGTHI